MLNPEPAPPPRPPRPLPLCVEIAHQHINKIKRYATEGYDKPAADHVLTGAINYNEWRRHFDSRIVAKVPYFDIYFKNGGDFSLDDLIQQLRVLGITPDHNSLKPIAPMFANAIAALFRTVLLATMEPDLAEEIHQQFPRFSDGIEILKYVDASFNLVSPRLVYYKIHRILKLNLLHKNGSHLQARAKFWDLVNQGDDDVYRDVDLYHAIILMGLVDTEGREFCLDVMDEVYYRTGTPLSRAVLDMARDQWRQRCRHTTYNPLCSVDDATSFDGILSTHPFLGDNVPLVARMSRYKIDGKYVPVRRMPKEAPLAPLEDLLGVELTPQSPSGVPAIIQEILESSSKDDKQDSDSNKPESSEMDKAEEDKVDDGKAIDDEITEDNSEDDEVEDGNPQEDKADEVKIEDDEANNDRINDDEIDDDAILKTKTEDDNNDDDSKEPTSTASPVTNDSSNTNDSSSSPHTNVDEETLLSKVSTPPESEKSPQSEKSSEPNSLRKTSPSGSAITKSPSMSPEGDMGSPTSLDSTPLTPVAPQTLKRPMSTSVPTLPEDAKRARISS